MAIARRAIAGDQVDINPRKAEIESAWQPIRAALAARNGREAGNLLAELRDRDKFVFNACYWRADRWLDSWFQSRATDAPDDRDEQWEFARAAKSSFLHGIYSDRDYPDNWQTADLAYICQELPLVVAFSGHLKAEGGAS
jgi:hypothetical protein